MKKEEREPEEEVTEEELDERLRQWKKTKWCRDMHEFYAELINVAMRLK